MNDCHSITPARTMYLRGSGGCIDCDGSLCGVRLLRLGLSLSNLEAAYTFIASMKMSEVTVHIMVVQCIMPCSPGRIGCSANMSKCNPSLVVKVIVWWAV